MTDLTNLIEDCCYAVFSFLGKHSLVRLRQTSWEIKAKVDNYISRRLTFLDLSDIVDKSATKFVWLLNNCHMLEKLNAGGWNFVTFNFCKMVSNLSCLTSLNLEDAHFCDEEFSKIVCNCTKLENLNITFNTWITDDSLLNVVNLPNLKTLKLSVFKVTDRSICEILRSCIKLEHIIIDCPKLSDVSLAEMANLPLKTINLLDLCKNVSDVGIQQIAFGCCQLEEFVLQKNYIVTDESIRLFGDHCKSLRKLTVNQCERLSDISICHVVENCPKLEKFSASYCPLVTEKSFICVADNCNLLKDIELVNDNIATDEVILKIANKCLQLEHLFLGCSGGYTDMAIKYLAQHSRQLKSLFVVEDINEIVLCDLAVACSNIECLRVVYSGVSDKFLLCISKHLPGLKCLETFHSVDLTDKGVDELVQKCSRLEELYMRGVCEYITDRAYRSIGIHCKNLKKLKICVSRNITTYGIRQLVKCKYLCDLEIIDSWGQWVHTETEIIQIIEKSIVNVVIIKDSGYWDTEKEKFEPPV